MSHQITTIVITVTYTIIITVNTRASIFVSLLLTKSMESSHRVFDFDWN